MCFYKQNLSLIAYTYWKYYKEYRYVYLRINKNIISLPFFTITFYTCNITHSISRYDLEKDKRINSNCINILNIFKSIALQILKDKNIENKRLELEKEAYKLDKNILFLYRE